MFRSESITALLRPVVPEVNISTIRPSWPTQFGQLPGSGILVAVHGAEQRAVSGLQLGTAAVVNAVVQNQGRLHLAQLIFQLLPGLFLVQSHENAAGEDDAEGRHAKFIAVPAQQHHTAALEVRHFVFR